MGESGGFTCGQGYPKRILTLNNTNITMNLKFQLELCNKTDFFIWLYCYPKDWNVKYEEDTNKCINKSITWNDYYYYV